MSTLTEFASNRGEGDDAETVAGRLNDELRDLRELWSRAPDLAICTAYFNVGGFRVLADELEQAGRVRLLIGADPTDAAAGRRPATRTSRRTRRDPEIDVAVQQNERALVQQRDLLGFTTSADASARRLIAWLREHDVHVRRLTSEFLHGKAFVVETRHESAMVGSSNFTYAGLMKNLELNLIRRSHGTVGLVLDWYDEIWDRAESYDLASLYEARFVAHQPHDIFLRMLWERYGDSLDEDAHVTSELGLTQFQQDGVWRARRILAQRSGVVIADEVGLGKTFLAGELIREAAIGRRQKVLVVAPATLRDSTWRPFLADRALPAQVVSYDELVNALDTAGGAGSVLSHLNDYAMVVVDEAHNLRNAGTLRAESMRQLLGGGVPKELVLLTATPVNNSLTDLHTLISYITPADGAFNDIGVPSLKAYFDAAQAQAPEDLSPAQLFTVLDAVAVRRTRRFVKRHYAHERVTIGGESVAISFPTPDVRRVDYSLDAVLPGFFDRLATALGAKVSDDELEASGVVLGHEGEVLTMARYVPSRFQRGAAVEQYQAQNAGLLRSALLKRFESSASAFAGTVATMVASHDSFLAALDAGWVLVGDALRSWTASDTDDVTELIGRSSEAFTEDNARRSTEFDEDALRDAVAADRHLLAELGAAARSVGFRDDPKIEALVAQLASIQADAERFGIGDEDTRDRRKVLLFTYFADTARYVHGALESLAVDDSRLAELSDRMVLVTGSDRRERQDAIMGFAPRTAGPVPLDDPAADRFDLAVSTDVLSEGVNLQQARHIVNYDLPWNPMRLVQRHGRVDRIGSRHDEIHLRCFFPDEQLESLLRLEERLQRKLHQAAAAFGSGVVLPGVEAVERVISEKRAEIARLQAEDAALFEDGGSAAASGEEFRRRLSRAFESAATRGRVLALPGSAGTGLVRAGAEPGVVFCARIGDHPVPEFRWVPLSANGSPVIEDGGPVVVRDVLACLEHADPGDDEAPAHQPDGIRESAIAAWAVALADIVEDWNFRADPRNTEPALPAVMRAASRVVREHGAALGDRQDAVARRLAQPVDVRVQREVRRILRDHDRDVVLAASALARAADDLRLPLPTPTAPPAPLPADGDGVRLVCWVAVLPG